MDSEVSDQIRKTIEDRIRQKAGFYRGQGPDREDLERDHCMHKEKMRGILKIHNNRVEE